MHYVNTAAESAMPRVNGEKLYNMCKSQAQYHEGRAADWAVTLERLRKNAALVQESFIPTTAHSTSNYMERAQDPVRNAEAHVRRHDNAVRKLLFMAENLHDGPYYLTDDDLLMLGVLRT